MFHDNSDVFLELLVFSSSTLKVNRLERINI